MKAVCRFKGCGGTVFGQKVPVTGTWYQAFEVEKGQVNIIEVSTDGVKETAYPKTVICEKCMRKQRSPLWR